LLELWLPEVLVISREELRHAPSPFPGRCGIFIPSIKVCLCEDISVFNELCSVGWFTNPGLAVIDASMLAMVLFFQRIKDTEECDEDWLPLSMLEDMPKSLSAAKVHYLLNEKRVDKAKQSMRMFVSTTGGCNN